MTGTAARLLHNINLQKYTFFLQKIKKRCIFAFNLKQKTNK